MVTTEGNRKAKTVAKISRRWEYKHLAVEKERSAILEPQLANVPLELGTYSERRGGRIFVGEKNTGTPYLAPRTSACPPMPPKVHQLGPRMSQQPPTHSWGSSPTEAAKPLNF